MSEAQGYIVRLLRKVELALQDGALRGQRGVMAKVVSRLSHTDDVHASLERLYAVHGYDRFALRLMWLLEHAAERTDRLDGPATEYDVENLLDDLKPLAVVPSGGKDSAGVSSRPEGLEVFHESLHAFGRALDDVRRRSFEAHTFVGLEEDSLYQILAHTDALQRAARGVGKEDVVKFTTACSEFVSYALDRGRLRDVRVINMLEHANLTLQTVLAAPGTEEYDSLQKSIELLQNPREVLE